jgi:2-polyprenyl-3-methyl-5-hydroxy-6-metoxy-1,4-benzoquinol methylase
MHNRKCPFCRSDSFRTVGIRVDEWVKCLNCRSIFRDVTPARSQQIHDEAFQDSEFIDAMLAAAGEQPQRARWDLLGLPGGSVLEIGPGTGHLLAAAKQAGCSVEAVESSEVHRDYIRDVWGIESVYATMDEIPPDRTFDTVVAINVFEHIYDISDFLRAVRKVLAPGGTFFISTPNAISLEATVLGTWWSMCKVHDHFCFPSSAGLTTAARESGLQVRQIWSAGLPFEFPVSVLVAARDRVRARRGTAPSLAGEAPAGGSANPAAKTALNRFYSIAAPFDPAYRVIGALGRAASVRARLTC